MEIPSEVAVMTLPNVTLFPQALLPLYIFEPRYRRMLADALAGKRMFIVAMKKPNQVRDMPSAIAGLGLIRVCVDNPDGTSHLIIQGITRVELKETVRYIPYRVQRIRPLQAPLKDSVTIDALLAKVRDLVTERIQLGLPFPFPVTPKLTTGKKERKSHAVLSIKEIITYLDKLNDPDQVADLVSCALLPGALERQTILETVEVEPRLKHLIHFLMAEISQHRKNRTK
jgi:ATP-dependent Lon protease